MTKIVEGLRRADRALAISLLLVLVTAPVATGGDNPHTNHQHTVQLRGSMNGPDRTASDRAILVPVSYSEPTAAESALPTAPSAEELAMVRLAREQRCLAEVMYYEARGEGTEGEEAIAEVVFHRMHSRGYPDSICGVVYQGASAGSGCQFSFACGGEAERPKTPGAWARARLLAAKILHGYVALTNATAGATSFHAIDVAPDWTGLERTVQIGNHVFYRPLARMRAS